VLSECILLLDGGAETTRTVIGSIIRELALQPDQRQILLDRPDVLGDTAVEEFIRWVAPILNMRRTVTETHELHGKTLREGDEVLLMPLVGQPRQALRRPGALRRGACAQPPRGVRVRRACLSARRSPVSRSGDVRAAAASPTGDSPGTEPKIMPATFARAYDAVHIEFTPGA
jgi:cytochrome P450 family 142 subfamily A polypeptide 1